MAEFMNQSPDILIAHKDKHTQRHRRFKPPSGHISRIISVTHFRQARIFQIQIYQKTQDILNDTPGPLQEIEYRPKPL